MPASFVYGKITLNFAFGGRPVKVSVKYRYYAQDKRVEYEGLECVDEKLRENIENDPVMKERINSYVAKALERRNEGLS